MFKDLYLPIIAIALLYVPIFVIGMGCSSLDADKFQQAMVGNTIVVEKYIIVSEGLRGFIDMAMSQNANDPVVMKLLSEWKTELDGYNADVATVASKLLELVKESPWPSEVKIAMVDLLLQVVNKWTSKE